MKKLLLAILPVAILTVVLIMPARFVKAYSNNDLIDDTVFDNTSSMSAAQIDSWLNAHFPNSCISTNNGFTAPDPTGYSPDANFMDGQWSYGSPVSAGRVIYDAAVAHSVNPQVLITKLENEENLVTGNSGCATWQYASAVGYGCTDSGSNTHNYSYTGASPYTNSSVLATPLYYHNGVAVNSITSSCVNQNVKAGFSEQVAHAAWLLSYVRHKSEGQTSWAAVHGSWDHCEDNNSCPAGDNIPSTWACYSGFMTQGYFKRCPTDASTTYYDGYATIDGSSVHIDTGATAALYVYTPHFQSFDSIFSPWFGSPTGSTLFKVSGSATIYLDWGGYYYPIPSPAMVYYWGLNGIVPRTLSALPSGETEGPLLSTAAKFGSDNPSDPDYTATIDLVEGGQRHDAPNWTTLNAYGITSYTNYPSSLSWALQPGALLTPVVRAPNGSIFLVQNAKKRAFPDWTTFSTLSGPNYAGTIQVYSQQTRTDMSALYIDNMNEGAPMLLDGRFIKADGSASIYLYDNGKKLPFNPAAYAAWGRRLDYIFPEDSVSQIPNGSPVSILVSSSSGTNYLVDQGEKKVFSASVEAAWGLNNGQFTQMTDSALARLGNSTATSLIRVPSGAVFSVQNGQRHGIPSMSDFSRLGYSWSNVDNVNDYASSIVSNGAILFAPGDLLRTPNGAVHVVNSNYQELGITYGALFSRFGYSWSNVRNVGYYALNGYTESSLQPLLMSSSDGKYYEVDMGTKHYVDSTTFSSSDYGMAGWPYDQVDPSVLNGIKTGPQLTQFIRGSGPTVYYIQNGQRHGITSEAKFYSLGGSWSEVLKVSDDFLSEIPNGSII